MTRTNSQIIRKTLEVQLVIFLCTLIGISCATSSNSKISNQKSQINLDWLLGDWIRTNDEEGRTTYELWTKNSNEQYAGIGVTIASNGDTVFREDLKVISIDEQWVLEVRGVNEAPTLFTFKETGAQNLSVQNLENEFPKYIEYWRDGSQLKAKVYNDENEFIEFAFAKNP